jgi:regulatory protein
MARVTALRAARRGRVAVELDGSAWRVLPVDVVARVGLTVGVEADRPLLRLLRRELRRHDALLHGARTLAARDVSRRKLKAKLERAGFVPAERAEAIGTLSRLGLVDDERFALGRAAALAARGVGDGGVRWELEQQGIAAELVDRAVAELEPEPERAARLVARRGAGPATARLLARRGFSAETIETALDRGLGADG